MYAFDEPRLTCSTTQRDLQNVFNIYITDMYTWRWRRGGGAIKDRQCIIISLREGSLSASTGLNTVKHVLFARLLSGRRLFLGLMCSCCCLHPQNLPDQHLHGYLRGSAMIRPRRRTPGRERPCTRAVHEQPVDSVVVKSPFKCVLADRDRSACETPPPPNG